MYDWWLIIVLINVWLMTDDIFNQCLIEDWWIFINGRLMTDECFNQYMIDDWWLFNQCDIDDGWFL